MSKIVGEAVLGLAEGEEASASALSKMGKTDVNASQAFNQFADSSAGAVATDHLMTGIEDLFETDAALARKQKLADRTKLVDSEVQDRATARQLAMMSRNDALRKQMVKEELQKKLIDRELAGGKPLGYVPPPDTSNKIPSFTPAPSILPAYDLGAMQDQKREKERSNEKLRLFGGITKNVLDYIKDDEDDDEDKLEEMRKEEKAKYKAKKEKHAKKAVQKHKTKQEVKELEKKAEELKKFLKENDALTKKEEKALDKLAIEKEIMELKKMQEEEKRAIKKADLEEQRAHQDKKAKERLEASLAIANARKK